MTNFTSSASAHALKLVWIVESKDGPKAKWRELSAHQSQEAARAAKHEAGQNGGSVRIRMVAR